MPANRSRTNRWRDCLRQIHQRQGAIEIAVAPPEEEGAAANHLVWRVRILSLADDEIVVEPPVALGQHIHLRDGVPIVAVIAVGQNRWLFRTENLGAVTTKTARGDRAVAGLRLRMPATVERCQRRHPRHSPRVETLSLPEAEVWPLLDPKSVVVAERANELQLQRPGSAAPEADDEHVMPEVGPRFTGLLLNVGGGGVGLQVAPEHAQVVSRYRVFWMRIALPPELSTPICASTKLVHTHMRSDQHLYAGLAFDFTFNPAHERFVADQICRFIAVQQGLRESA
jgi:hypothetical protein